MLCGTGCTGLSPEESGRSRSTITVVKVPSPTPTVTLTARKFKNCTALNKALPHGVGRPGAVDKVSHGMEPVADFFIHSEFYQLNKHLDRDGDGIACEAS